MAVMHLLVNPYKRVVCGRVKVVGLLVSMCVLEC